MSSDLELEEDSYTMQACITKRCGLKDIYTREYAIRLDLVNQIKDLKEENETYRGLASSLASMVKRNFQPDHALIRLMRWELENLQIAEAYYYLSEDIINFWFIPDEEDYDLEMKIARLMSKIYSTYVNLKIDFAVIPRSLIDVKDMLPSGAINFLSLEPSGIELARPEVA